MEDQFLNLTEENLDREHLCCIIRSKKPHPGVEAKRVWLRERLRDGHVFRKLDTKGVVFIEYAPLETAWVPVEGDNYLYLYVPDGGTQGSTLPVEGNSYETENEYMILVYHRPFGGRYDRLIGRAVVKFEQ